MRPEHRLLSEVVLRSASALTGGAGSALLPCAPEAVRQAAGRVDCGLRAAAEHGTASTSGVASGRASALGAPWGRLGTAGPAPPAASSCLPSSAFASCRYGTTSLQQEQHSQFGTSKWRELAAEHRVNPCNSTLHPAVNEGILPDGQELCVQDAYNAESTCFGCGPANPDGLQLRSKRIVGGLEARIRIPAKYCAFPGIINGGILSTIVDCHGNWTAAIALMDKAYLPRPPLTLTASVLVTYKETTPPDTELLVRSRVVDIKDSLAPGMGPGKTSVEVDVDIYLAEPHQPADAEEAAVASAAAPGQQPGLLLVHGSGIFRRMGALRSL